MNSTSLPSLEPARWVENHRDYLLHFALGKVRNHTIAEDLVQETFLAAWKAHEKFQGRSSERTWLTRILLNKIADHYRSAARKPSVANSQLTKDEGDDEALEAFFFQQDPESNVAKDSPREAAEHSEFLELLDRYLDQIPEQAASAYRMRELQGLSTEDITRQLDITPNHLWVLIHRAKKALRDHLEAIWETVTPPQQAAAH